MKRSFFGHFLAEEWKELRTLGRDRFVWRERVLTFGVPLGVALATVQLFDRAEPLSFRTVLISAFYVLGSALFTYIEARLEWKRRESEYQESRSRE